MAELGGFIDYRGGVKRNRVGLSLESTAVPHAMVAFNATLEAASVDGVSQEIDLTAEQASQWRSAIDPYASHARQVGPSAFSGTRGHAGASDYDASSVNTWAAAHGLDVSVRGRISKDALEKGGAASN